MFLCEHMSQQKILFCVLSDTTNNILFLYLLFVYTRNNKLPYKKVLTKRKRDIAVAYLGGNKTRKVFRNVGRKDL